MAKNDMLKSSLDWVETMNSPISESEGAAVFGFVKGRTVIWCNAGDTTPTDLAIAGGAVRLPMGGDNADTAQMYGPLAFEPDESQTMWMQARFRVTDVSVSSIFVGFTDQNAASEVPMEDEGGTLESVATDAFGILLEGPTDGTWQTVGVQNDTHNAQAVTTNIADLTDSEWTTVKVECSLADSGSMRVWVDGIPLETANTTSTKSFGNHVTTSFLRSSIVYAPVISADDRNSAYNLDIAEFAWSGSVGASFD